MDSCLSDISDINNLLEMEKQNNKNESWKPRKLCQYLAFNTLYHTLFGDPIKRDSKLYLEMSSDFDKTFEYLAINELAIKFTFLQYFKSIFEELTIIMMTMKNRKHILIIHIN